MFPKRLVTRCLQSVSRLEQTIKLRRQCGGNNYRVSRAADGVHPVRRRQAQCFLQDKTRCVRRPRDRGVPGCGGSKRERGCVGDLHRRGQRPESPRDGILPVGQRTARVRLTDGAAHGIDAASAGAAAAVNREPVDGVLLRETGGGKQEHGKYNEFFIIFGFPILERLDESDVANRQELAVAEVLQFYR